VSPQEISGWLWGGWYAFWLISAHRRLRSSNGSSQREPWPGRVGYLSLMLMGFMLIFWEAPQLLHARFLPAGSITAAIGLLIELAGLIFAIWARQTLGENWSGRIVTGDVQELITARGPYRIVRHPIYSGLLLAVLGTALAVGEFRAVCGFGLVLCGVLLKVRREEVALRSHFGPAYERYARDVPALLPGHLK